MTQTPESFSVRKRRLRRGGIGVSIGCLLPFIALSLPATVLYAWDLADEWSWETIGLFIVSAAASVWLVAALVSNVRDAHRVRVVPYFAARIGKWDTFSRTGFALAEQFEVLESLAEQRGLTPLSSFGFEDEWADEKAQWHPAAVALESVRGLLAAVRSTDSLSGREALVEDLERLEDTLAHADAADIAFCLHLRSSDEVVSPMEMDQRKGSYY